MSMGGLGGPLTSNVWQRLSLHYCSANGIPAVFCNGMVMMPLLDSGTMNMTSPDHPPYGVS